MNYQSNNITAVLSAIEKARLEFKPLKKSGINNFFKNPKTNMPHLFSTLDDIFDSCLDALNKNKLSITYQVRLLETSNGYENILTTLISHLESGEYISSASSLGNQTTKMQDIGSAITYMRRYQIQAMLNLEADFEDDGNNASGNTSGDIETNKPSRQYITFDDNGKQSGIYTDFNSYIKALENKVSDEEPWVESTYNQLNDIIEWTKTFKDTDKKHGLKIVKKCNEEINKIKEKING